MLDSKVELEVQVVETMVGDTPPLHDVSVHVGNLLGPEGNAWVLIGCVASVLRKHVSAEVADAYSAEARSGDYLNVLETSAKYATIRGINLGAVIAHNSR